MSSESASRFSKSLSIQPRRSSVAGLSFAEPEVLQALGGSPDIAAALPTACRRLSLDFAFVPETGGEDLIHVLSEQGCAPLVVIEGPLGRTLREMGWTEVMRAAVAEPDVLAGPLAAAEVSAFVAAEAALEAGAAGLVVAEELAFADGPLLPPDFVFSEVLTRHLGVLSLCEDRAVPALLHTDGDPRAFLGALARAGYSALHGGGGLDLDRFEEVLAAARRVGMVVIGGILTSDLVRSPLSAVSAGSRVGVLARGGGLLLSDDGGMTTRTEATAFVVALEAARDAAEGGLDDG